MRKFIMSRFLVSFCFGYFASIGAANAWNPFAPDSYEECVQDAAKKAKSESALQVLMVGCDSEFPARKSDSGGYIFYDAETGQNVPVSSPRLSANDKTKIQQARQAYRERIAAEQRRQAAINAEALKNVSIKKWAIECVNEYYCNRKSISVTVANNSKYSITSIVFGNIVAARIASCDGELPSRFPMTVRIPPGRSGMVSFEVYDGPSVGRFRSCLSINGVSAE